MQQHSYNKTHVIVQLVSCLYTEYKHASSEEKGKCLIEIEQRDFTVFHNVEEILSSNGEKYQRYKERDKGDAHEYIR